MLFLAPVGSILALGFAFYLAVSILRMDEGNDKMKEIAEAVRIGAKAYLKRQYLGVFLFFVVVFFILLALALNKYLPIFVPFSFLTGGFFSGLSGFIGMTIATKSSNRTAAAAMKSLNSGLRVAFSSGAVMGLTVVGLGLLDLSIWYYFLNWYYSAHPVPIGMDKITAITSTMLCFGMGASSQALFARVGGGIFTKAADVGADLVGKIEAGIPEDDPRNPAVFADNVGDNVGDCAGMAADLFETYVVTLTAALLLGFLAIGSSAVAFSFALASAAILASIIASFFVRLNPKEGPERIMRALYRGLISAIVISAVLFYPLAKFYFTQNYLGVYLSALIGLAVTLLMVLITDYYTAKHFRPVRSIAEASASGHGTNIIMGLAVGMESTFLPIIVITGGILLSFWLAGLFGIAVAALSMLSVSGVVVAIDSFGPITHNAGGIAEMTSP